MKTSALAAAALLTLAAAAQAQPKAEPKVDKLTLRKGGTVEGTIQREAHNGIVIQIAGGAPATYSPSDVLKIEYWDAPAALRAALTDVEAGNWQEAINKINSAEETVDMIRREKKQPPPRAFWFDAWVLYYRGLCKKELAQADDAIKWLKKLIEKHKEARLLPEAYELVLECYREKGDVPGANDFMKELDKAPEGIRAQLKKRAQKQQAEILLEQGKAAEALPIFESLARDPDPVIRVEATAGVIKCKRKSGTPDDLVRFCEGVIPSSNDPALQLVASNAIGESYLDRKLHDKARAAFVNSVVRYHPGRASPMLREHERALYLLGRCYEELAAAAKDPAAKKSLEIMAGRTYRELSLEYPSGKYRDEAAAKASRLDKTD